MFFRKLILALIVSIFVISGTVSYSYEIDYSPYYITSDYCVSPGYLLYVVNCEVSVSLRYSPATDADIITQVPKYACVQYLGNARNGYLYVDYNGMIGYILAAYLDYREPHTEVGHFGTIANVNESASLRSLPTAASPAYTQMPKGSTVTEISDINDGFYKVTYNGMKGYVMKSLVQLYTDSSQKVYGTYYNQSLMEFIDITPNDPTSITVEFYDYTPTGERNPAYMKVNYVMVNNNTWSSVAADYGKFSLDAGAQVICYDGLNTIAFVPYGYSPVYYYR